MSQYLIKDRESCLYKYLSLLHIHSFQIESLAQMFSCEFYEISKNTFFTEILEPSKYLPVQSHRNTRKRCEICSKLTLKTERHLLLRCEVFIVNSEQISHLFVVFLSLTWGMFYLLGKLKPTIIKSILSFSFVIAFMATEIVNVLSFWVTYENSEKYETMASYAFLVFEIDILLTHWMKSVQIWSFMARNFPYSIRIRGNK